MRLLASVMRRADRAHAADPRRPPQTPSVTDRKIPATAPTTTPRRSSRRVAFAREHTGGALDHVAR